MNSAAFATEKKATPKQLDRVAKVAAMTNEERQGYRQDVLDNIESYRQGLDLLKKKIVKANERRNEKALDTLYGALAAMSSGAIAYLSSTRAVKGQNPGKLAAARLAVVVASVSTGFTAVTGGIATRTQVDVNRLQTEIDKSIEELNLLQTELEAITDLTPKE
ncbi:hypothetical protein D3C72_1374600 [compost metagenome]